MKAFFASVTAALVIAIGAVYALDLTWQRRADQAFISPTSVRIPDHGETHNLVGKDWYSAKEH
jgi:hypothetical protein